MRRKRLKMPSTKSRRESIADEMTDILFNINQNVICISAEIKFMKAEMVTNLFSSSEDLKSLIL